jgi:hypothetical protein
VLEKNFSPLILKAKLLDELFLGKRKLKQFFNNLDGGPAGI